MLHIESVEPSTLELLRRIQALPALAETRLVGGTALALQLGSRLGRPQSRILRRRRGTAAAADAGAVRLGGGEGRDPRRRAQSLRRDVVVVRIR